MGMVIAFPFERAARRSERAQPEHGADIVILPVVRIERQFGPLPGAILQGPQPDTSGRRVR
ncbi:MAG: hypothetical protein AB1698_15940 [Pseudomonadota bacterium]